MYKGVLARGVAYSSSEPLEATQLLLDTMLPSFTKLHILRRCGSPKAVEKHRKLGSKEGLAEWSRVRDPDKEGVELGENRGKGTTVAIPATGFSLKSMTVAMSAKPTNLIFRCSCNKARVCVGLIQSAKLPEMKFFLEG